MIKNLKELFNISVFWKISEHVDCDYIFTNDDIIFTLTINDFPEEEMYTVSNGKDSINFDDLPIKWSVEIKS